MKWIEIKTAKELAQIKDMSGCYRLVDDIDMSGVKFTPIGSETKPFEGVFDGAYHCINGLEIKANGAGAIGLFAVNKGTIQSLYLNKLSISGKCTGSSCVGAFAGINYGKIYGAFGSDNKLSLDVSGSAVIGGFAGRNYGQIINGNFELDTKLSSKGEITFGAFVGDAEAGLLETLEKSGKTEISGDVKKVYAGLYAGSANCVIIRACISGDSWNTVNDKLYQTLVAAGKDYRLDGNIWRDNRNDDCFLSAKQLKARKLVEEHMRKMGTVKWNPDRDLDMPCTCGGATHHQVFPEGEEQSGIPYSHHCGSYERFMAAFTEDGKLQPFVRSDGIRCDEAENYLDLDKCDMADLYIGNDCSMAVMHALARIQADIDYEWTWTGTPFYKKGILPIEGYDAMFTDNTGDIIAKNGKQKIAEAFAKQHIGDPMVHAKKASGHFRMNAKNPVVFRQDDGKIDCFRSYAITHEQGDGLLYNPKKQAGRSFLIEYHYSFEHLFGEEFIPLTTKPLQTGDIDEAKLSYKGAKGSAMLDNGSIKTNYRILAVTARLIDAEGKAVLDKELFPDIHGYDGHGNDKEVEPLFKKGLDPYIEKEALRPQHRTRLKKEYNMRKPVKEIDLAIFKPYTINLKLSKGSIYNYKLDVLLANGKIYTVADTSFKA